MAYVNQYELDMAQDARSNRNYAAIGDAVTGVIKNIGENRRRAIDEGRKEKADKQASFANRYALSKDGHSSEAIDAYEKTGDASAMFNRNALVAEAARKKASEDADLDRRTKESIINKNNKYQAPGATGAASKEAAKAAVNGTVGEQAVDKKYAENYNNFSTKGVVNSQHSINKLEKIAEDLEKDQGFGEAGGTTLPIPDMFRSNLAIERRDGARSAANSTLKELFGGQLSDGERIAAANEYYNDKLDNKTNAKILREKIEQLKSSREAEIQKAKHYEENGTLRGFRLNANPLPKKERDSAPLIHPVALQKVQSLNDQDLIAQARALGIKVD